ncbi:MAG: succinate dehydrogenase, cytochrome b556 subunit [Sphingobium sp.]|nr:succinate dehydrogenase, cytochrome b556 subunit [Sphingobium sp.]MBP6112844.1 succinate dehydrogenase, cytochrome b556 subunit [Sphingobium sp.]MBP8670787.1 succinate dehydrogenase, cytochrome b556 subunit [Sphingobium sp.]MBP9157739.1 succinate dehydrogenase, cytochrome b556 subunit [Sphingobium sp.]MCC6481030.1 succinate dehydrogenase, cytochrome b556 subunit [Sphingomonadaceae bacterium]
MAQARKGTKNRPLSPHLGIWRWGPHMALSILHRVTGSGMAVIGMLGIVWWLVAAASGPDAYATFLSCATSPVGYIILIGLSWAFFQHLLSGLRHFVLDIGAGYELQTNKTWSLMIPALAIVITAAVWLLVFAGRI